MRRLAVPFMILLATRARAEGPAPATIIGAAGRPPDAVALVGQGGEIFLRDGGVWRRHGGGVAAALARAWGPSSTEVWAAGARPPIYQHDGRSWSAVPGTSGAGGPSLLAEPWSPLPALAVGRRIFVLEGKHLVPATAAPGLPTALWAAAAKDLSVLVDGKLLHYTPNGGWKPVPGAGESLVAIGPRVALGQDGGVYTIDSKLHKIAPEDATLAGFRPRLVALGKRMILVGALGDGYAAAALDGGKLVLLGRLPGLARADEPVGLAVGDAEMIIVSRSGLVLAGDGKSWKTEAIAAAVSEAPHAAEPPARIPVPDAPP